MSIYKRVLEQVIYYKRLRLEGKDISIPFPFDRFSNYVPGVEKGRYIIVTAGTKVGKTKITDFLFLYSPIEYVLSNDTNIKIKVKYFTLEMSKEDKIREAICYKLYRDYGIIIDTQKLQSIFKKEILDDKIEQILLSNEYKHWFNEFEKRVEFIDNIRNPYGIYKYIRDYAHKNGVYLNKHGKVLDTLLIETGDENEIKEIDYYKPNDPDEYVIVITDHVSLLLPEENKHYSLHDAMGDFSSNYCLKMRDRWKYIVVNVQQQAASQESTENVKLNMLQPSANGLADNKLTGRDCDMMLGLFAPSRYKIRSYEGYDITKLRDNYRELSVILNRRGNAVSTSLFFNGSSNYFEELPEVHYFEKNPDLYEQYRTY